MMLRHIKPLTPEHITYNEPFFGGGAFFFSKPRAKVEVINDINDNVINFYRVYKNKPTELYALVESTLHSRSLYYHAKLVYHNPDMIFHDPIKRAWAFWVLCNQGFSAKIDTWGYDKSAGAKPKTLIADKARFLEVAQRLEHTQIECHPAHKVIKSYDTPDTFHYCDPPYIASDQGHYKGYTKVDFERDLGVLESIKGKFLLSSYSGPLLKSFVKKNRWQQIRIEKGVAISHKVDKRKVEVLTANYDILGMASVS